MKKIIICPLCRSVNCKKHKCLDIIRNYGYYNLEGKLRISKAGRIYYKKQHEIKLE